MSAQSAATSQNTVAQSAQEKDIKQSKKQHNEEKAFSSTVITNFLNNNLCLLIK